MYDLQAAKRLAEGLNKCHLLDADTWSVKQDHAGEYYVAGRVGYYREYPESEIHIYESYLESIAHLIEQALKRVRQAQADKARK